MVLNYLAGVTASSTSTMGEARAANAAWGVAGPYRSDTVPLVNNLATFVDANAVAGDAGKTLTGTGLTGQTVLSVVGTTVTMSAVYGGTTGSVSVTFNNHAAKAASNNADGTPRWEVLGALNAKNGTTGLGLGAVCNALAGTTNLSPPPGAPSLRWPGLAEYGGRMKAARHVFVKGENGKDTGEHSPN